MSLSLTDINGEFREGYQRRREVRSGMDDETAIKQLIGLGEANRPAYEPIRGLQSAHVLPGAGKDINEPLEPTLNTIEWPMAINSEAGGSK